MKLRIYFAGSILGGRNDVDLYHRLIEKIKETDVVLTEHIGNAHYSTESRTLADEQRIYDQDTAWLRECDAVVAECSQPSLGVGYEMAYAEALKKPVAIFCRKSARLSAMLTGDPYFRICFYEDESALFAAVQVFLDEIRSTKKA